MSDDVIPLNEIGKIETVKVYNQAYVDKQQKRIQELEVTNKQISAECHKLVDTLEKKQKENAELKCECRRCVYTDCPCVLSDYGKDRNGICNHFKDVFAENAELKKEVLEVRQHLDLTEREWGKDTTKLIHFKTQLTKATEIIRELLTCARNYPESNKQKMQKAEQFLSEVKK